MREQARNNVASEIFEWMIRNHEIDCSTVEFEHLSDKILPLPSLDAYVMSKPSGLVVEKDCPWFPHGNIPPESCPDCHGTGVITRELTRQEKSEVIDMLLDGRATFHYTLGDDPDYILLPSGERVSVEGV